MVYRINVDTAEEMLRLGECLGRLLQPGHVVLLSGDLGVGKTTLAQGVARGLGVNRPVTSPTFTLIHEYQGRMPLYHIDLYRLSGEEETLDLGLTDYMEPDGATLLEWPERAPASWPDRFLKVTISGGEGSGRVVEITTNGEDWQEIVKGLERCGF